MKPRLLFLPLCLGSLAAPTTHAQSAPIPDAALAEQGEALFDQHCAACHQLTLESFGPPLGGITRLLSADELATWIGNPAAVLNADNPRAQALLARYKAPMPPFSFLGEDGLNAIVAYLAHETESRDLAPFAVDSSKPAVSTRSLIPPVVDSGLVVELKDVAQIPRLPDRPAYKGIAILRPDPRENQALLVSDLMGIIYRVNDGAVDVFFDFRDRFPRFVYEPGVATGLGCFAFHPDYLNNGLLYTTHSELWEGEDIINPADLPEHIPEDASPRLAWVLTEWHTADPLAPQFDGTPREVVRWVTPTTAHGSQEIAFAPVTGPDDSDYGMLYISHGDGGSINIKQRDNTGHPRSLMGSIMRIDPRGTNGRSSSYGIPPDNPFAGADDSTIRQELWAYGFRNAHRISWDITPTGEKRMIAVDIGESTVEEVNLIVPGGAYGWGVGRLEGSARIDILTDPTAIFPATGAELAPYVLPHGEYHHEDGTAITGGYVYHGPIAALRDKYVFGDIVNGRLFYMNFGADLDDHTIYELKVERDGEPTTIRKLSEVSRAHLRIGYDPRHGDLYVLTKDDGMIRRIVAAHAP